MKSKPHLFPHSYLPETVIKGLVSLLGPVRIYLPWFMDQPEFFKNYELEIINPPGDYKPGEDFRAVLSGCRAWSEQGHDRSRRESLKLSHSALPDDSATWDIRRMLRGAAQNVPVTEGEDLPLKYHLILHLNHEIEMRNFEIMEMAEKLKKKGAVLAGALNDPAEAKGVFADMDDLSTTGMPDNMNIGSMLDAWFGLFGGYIGENDILVTCSRPVTDHISYQWDNRDTDKESLVSHSMSFTFPDTSSGIYKQGDIAKIRESILGLSEDPDYHMSELQRLLWDYDKVFPRDSSQGALKIQIRHFPSMPNGMPFETNVLLRHIAGKTIILMSSP